MWLMSTIPRWSLNALEGVTPSGVLRGEQETALLEALLQSPQEARHTSRQPLSYRAEERLIFAVCQQQLLGLFSG